MLGYVNDTHLLWPLKADWSKAAPWKIRPQTSFNTTREFGPALVCPHYFQSREFNDFCNSRCRRPQHLRNANRSDENREFFTGSFVGFKCNEDASMRYSICLANRTWTPLRPCPEVRSTITRTTRTTTTRTTTIANIWMNETEELNVTISTENFRETAIRLIDAIVEAFVEFWNWITNINI